MTDPQYRVRVKLEGREPDALRRSTVGEQVDFVIREAQVIVIYLMIRHHLCHHNHHGESMVLT